MVAISQQAILDLAYEKIHALLLAGPVLESAILVSMRRHVYVDIHDWLGISHSNVLGMPP